MSPNQVAADLLANVLLFLEEFTSLPFTNVRVVPFVDSKLTTIFPELRFTPEFDIKLPLTNVS